MLAMTTKHDVPVSTALDSSSHEQLYFQLYNILFQGIVEGQYKVGDQIPSETELVKTYNVSRATVRKSMDLLVRNGLIERRRGIGSIVTSSTPTTALNRVTSYLKHRKEDARPATKKLVVQEIGAAPKEASVALALPEGAPVFHLVRVRCAGNDASYVEEVYIDNGYLPEISKHDFSKESLRAYYSSSLKEKWTRATQRIYAESAQQLTAQLLGVAVGAPLLTIYRTTFSSNNIPREYLIQQYRSDRYYLEMSLEN